MYIEQDSRGSIALHDMTKEEAGALLAMIEGTSLNERRIFHHVRSDLKKMLS